MDHRQGNLALKLSLAVAIQHGFVTILFFCIATIVVAFFLKDVPLAKEFREDPGETGAETSEQDVSEEPEEKITGATS